MTALPDIWAPPGQLTVDAGTDVDPGTYLGTELAIPFAALAAVVSGDDGSGLVHDWVLQAVPEESAKVTADITSPADLTGATLDDGDKSGWYTFRLTTTRPSDGETAVSDKKIYIGVDGRLAETDIDYAAEANADWIPGGDITHAVDGVNHDIVGTALATTFGLTDNGLEMDLTQVANSTLSAEIDLADCLTAPAQNDDIVIYMWIWKSVLATANFSHGGSQIFAAGGARWALNGHRNTGGGAISIVRGNQAGVSREVTAAHAPGVLEVHAWRIRGVQVDSYYAACADYTDAPPAIEDMTHYGPVDGHAMELINLDAAGVWDPATIYWWLMALSSTGTQTRIAFQRLLVVRR